MKLKNKAPLVYFVVPCFNEELRWNYDFWNDALKIEEVIWLFVDDGSTDSTVTIINSYEINKNVKLLMLPINRGKAEAVRSGLNYLLNNQNDANFVGYIDSDGAFAVDDIEQIIHTSHLKKYHIYDAFWSSRVKLAGRLVIRNSFRHFIARVLSSIFALKFNLLPYDSQSGLKIFKRSNSLVNVLSSPFHTRWLFELEILHRWKNTSGSNMNVWECPVTQWKDVADSKLRGREIIRVAVEIVRILLLKSR